MAERLQPPLFVLAAPFSGSSWLAGVLGQHPQLYALPQLFAFTAETVGELLDVFGLSQADHGDGLRRAVAQLMFGAQSEATIAQADAWLAERAALSVKVLIDLLAAAAAPRRLVIPDSEAALRPMELRRLLAAYPDAAVVHLVRHPWVQGCHLASWLQARLFVPVDYRDHGFNPPAAEPQIPWLRANANLEQALRASSVRSHRLGTEALDSHFAYCLTTLCEWLALDTTATALGGLQHPERWPFAQPGPASARGGLEAEVWDAPDPAAEALAATPHLEGPLPWRADGAGFDPQVIALAQRYGYR